MSINQPLVSVIIPVYNAEDYIAQAISSVLEQTYKKIEIIIIDDGSTDNSYNVAKQFEKQGITIIAQENKGVSAARNLGISKATGTYIQFLDADDFISPVKIQMQISAMNSITSPAFICSDWARVNDYSTLSNISIISNHIPKTQNLPIEFISGDNFIPLMSGLLNREYLIKIKGFDTSMTHIEDVNLLIKLYKENSSFIYLKSEMPFFFYRNVSNSTSKQNDEAFYKGVFKNCKLIKEVFGISNHHILFENFWNIYLFSVLHNKKNIAKEVAKELYPYKLASSNNIKFNIFKLAKNKLFATLYRIYIKGKFKSSSMGSHPSK